jgi:hypothetical protein
MWIGRGIAVAMVMSMMCSPPQCTFLCRCLCHKRYYKLKQARGFIRLMCEVAMVATRYPKHPEKVKEDAHEPIE